MSANDGAASSSNVAAEGNFEPSANNEAASSSNVDIIINSDQDANNEAASAEELQSSIRAAIRGDIELDSILTPNKDTILHIIMSQNRSSMEIASPLHQVNVNVEDILDKCPSLLYQVNVNVETPLHVAARHGRSDMVEVLIKSSAKPQHEDLESGIEPPKQKLIKMTNNEGDTALHVAVRNEHLDVVKILTREYPDFLYSSNIHGETPLYIAAAANAQNSLEIVVEILETCKPPTYEGPDQMTALHAVAKNFRPDIRRKILEKKKSLIKERDRYGWTPLHYASYHYNSMETLLECDISAAYIGDKYRKMTPLHIAIGRGYIPHKLISSCPDCFELVDERRWNVLHFAMLSLTLQDLIILLKDPLIRNLINGKDVDGNTPLHLLATFRKDLSWKIIDMSMDVKLDLGVVNSQNMTVLDVIRNSGSGQLKQEILKLEEAAGPYRDGVVRVRKESNDQDWRSGLLGAEEEKEYEKIKESHLIVAALVATVTFTAAFTLPGGVIQDGDKEGTAILSKKAAFQAFVITDAIALVFSLSAVYAHFLMSLHMKWISTRTSVFLLGYASSSTVMAMGAMVIAFVTGTYAVLTTSLWLAILTTFIGLSFFLLMFLIWKRANRVLTTFGIGNRLRLHLLFYFVF